MIHIQGLHKFFNKGRQNEIHVINDISLDLPEKGMVAIFGPSGCGKTTLLNVIGGLDKYASGVLTIEHQNIAVNTDVIRNKYIGYIFQNYNLHKSVSCYDNVADALRLCGMTDEEEIEMRVTAALRNVGMDKYAKRTPDTLSGGQQQRIAIARAIVKNPRIILADEPTGNLDEANTVMVMDLLKAISKDHLVLLVTHEANLVDHYCDTVIELRDGMVVGTKQNTAANGFAARDKNDIFLGELSRRDLADESAEIEYYGEVPEVPVKIRVVNYNGKLYVQVGTQKVQILDEFSEIKLRDGVYEEKAHRNAVSESIDMSQLPPIKGKRFGRLFSLASSIKSGFASNFQKRKKGKKLLCTCMCLFAAVIVFMSAVFGTSFEQIQKVNDAYNHNVFYVYTPSVEVSKKLNEAIGNEQTGVDFVRLMSDYPYWSGRVYFQASRFETFSQNDWQGVFSTAAIYLDMSLLSDERLVAGTRDGMTDGDIVITTKVADELLANSTVSYISEYEDLIGIVTSGQNYYGLAGTYRIVGIVQSNELAMYMTEVAMAKFVRASTSFSETALASDYGLQVESGEAILAIRYEYEDVDYPKIGETIKIQGRDIKIVDIKMRPMNYEDWLVRNGVEKKDQYTYFAEMVMAEHPEVEEGSQAFNRFYSQLEQKKFFEYYDYYYSEMDAYLKDFYFFAPESFEAWLYVQKGIEDLKYYFLSEDHYKAVVYKRLYGSYPTPDQLSQCYQELPSVFDLIDDYGIYANEFYSSQEGTYIRYNAYLVSDADYIAFSKQLGETHASAGNESVYYDKYAEGDKYVTYSYDGVQTDYVYMGNLCYTLVHSSDPDKTEAWIMSEFSNLTTPWEYYKAVIGPGDMFDQIMSDKQEVIVTGLISMGSLLVLMSICMYFIMRSSLMIRIKEVGIYRAIGVSKKNIVFKFFIEAIVLASLTVLVGYLAASGFVMLCLNMSSLAEFYYPLWLAGVDLVVLYAMCLFFGTIPILSLLRKTPSEILAKYDI